MLDDKSVFEYLSNQSEEYISELVKKLKLHKDTSSVDSTVITVCPFCGSIHIKKNGFDKNNNQRYLCKDCRHSFSESTRTLFWHSRITKSEWLRFIDLEITSMSLREEAYYMGLSITTCFFMRHKLYSAAAREMAKEKMVGDTELDCSYYRINLKGTKTENMPRMSKHRGSKSTLSGISHHKICVLSAIDEQDNMILKIVGLGPESLEKYRKEIDRFNESKLIVSDSKSCIQQFANVLAIDNDKIPVIANQKHYTTRNGNSLGDVNELIENFRTSNKFRHGYSTRYLQNYLDFYLLKKKYKYKYDRKDMASKIYQLLSGQGYLSDDDILLTEIPISLKEAYFDYHYGIFANS